MCEKEYVKLEGGRNISESIALSLIRDALDVDREPEPLCRHVATTHAAGVAVAGFAAITLADRMWLLSSAADVLEGEAKMEQVFTFQKMIEHEQMLDQFIKLARLVCPKRFREALSKSKSEEDAATEFMGLFGSLPKQFSSLFTLLTYLGDEVLDRMDDYICGEPESASNADCRNVLVPLLKKEIEGLNATLGCLDEIIQTLESAGSEVREDWTNNAEQLEAACTC